MAQDVLNTAQKKTERAFRVEALQGADFSAWDAYVSATDKCTLYHNSVLPKMIKQLFGHHYHCFLAWDESGKVIGVLPLIHMKSVLFGNYMVSMPYFNYGGAVAINEEVEQALMSCAIERGKSLNVTHIEFRDAHERDTSLPVRLDKVAMLLDLPEEPDILWQAIGAKRRSQIKRPIREGVEVLTGKGELLDQFYDVFARNMRDLGTPVYSKRFFQEIINRVSDNAHIVVVRHDDKPVAAAFLLGYRGQMEIPWASTLREVNKIGVNMFLYWEVLKYSIEQGFKTFDFGRSSVDSGTFRFKKQWGAKPKQLYWYYWMRDGGELPQLNPNNPKYQLVIKLWQKLPLALTKLLGPMIVKNLP